MVWPEDELGVSGDSDRGDECVPGSRNDSGAPDRTHPDRSRAQRDVVGARGLVSE